MPLRTEGVLVIIFPRGAVVSGVKSVANSRETYCKRVQLVFVAEDEALLAVKSVAFAIQWKGPSWSAQVKPRTCRCDTIADKASVAFILQVADHNVRSRESSVG